ncbi:MAG: hypothetical protein KatS3mg009_1794 [Acidimicrobiia bacterium]|nr:MAG: hypothetical protein KatS3mg009_1794 [Acidimicrobiia bacterium]
MSIVVVVYDMAREFPRTLRTLAPDYQRGIGAADYEVVVVDNGSPVPLDERVLHAHPGLRCTAIRIDDAPQSPAHAANVGLARASGDLVGLVVDGARMASPGLLREARRAAGVAPRPVVATLGWHLGATRHSELTESSGYDQRVEDELLAGVDWERNGYRLFEISTFASSSARGWFGPIGESSALFMPAAIWRELGGLAEEFTLPGGGLVNHDLFRRACELEGTQLVVVLGEGTFHQYHGGAATSRRLDWETMHAEYVAHRGGPYRPPENEPVYVGTVPTEALPHLEVSVARAIARRAKGRAR